MISKRFFALCAEKKILKMTNALLWTLVPVALVAGGLTCLIVTMIRDHNDR